MPSTLTSPNPFSSPSVSYPQVRCVHAPPGGGGEEEEEEGWEVFEPDADLQPEGVEEDMQVFQSYAGAGSRCV